MKLLNSFAAAFNGIGILIRTERNFQIHLCAFFLVMLAGLYYDIKLRQFGSILLVSALVFSLEAINTAIEKLCDVVSEEKKESIRVIKDISAGAVLIAAIFAVLVALSIFVPHVIGFGNGFNLKLF